MGVGEQPTDSTYTTPQLNQLQEPELPLSMTEPDNHEQSQETADVPPPPKRIRADDSCDV